MTYEPYIVAFIDILGFKDIVNKSESETNEFNKILDVLNKFKGIEKPETWKEANILVDIEECAQKKNLSEFDISGIVKCNCFSDCITVFVNADTNINERFSSLVAFLSKISCELLQNGIFIRGAITYGNLHTNKDASVFFGKAMNKAYTLESTIAVYPRILLSKEIVSVLNYPILEKRNRYPYHQYIERFNDGTVGFTPLIFFQVMQSAPDILNETAFHEALTRARYSIIEAIDNNIENPHIYEKFSWLRDHYNNLYINAPYHKDNIIDTNSPDSYSNIQFRPINEFIDSTKNRNTNYL